MSMNDLLEAESFFKQSLSLMNHPFDGAIKFDADWQRFACPESRQSQTTARYKAHSDGRPTLKFWCGKCGLSQSFAYLSDKPTELTLFVRQEIDRRRVEKERLDEENHKKCYSDMNKLWNGSKVCTGHQYFDSKKIIISESDGFRVTWNAVLLCPVMSSKGQLLSLQRIYWDKAKNNYEKRFFKGLSPKNGFYILGDIAAHKQVYFAEGVATAVTIRDATSKAVICVYGKHFDYIAPIVASLYPDKEFIFCADVDSKVEHNSEANAKAAVSRTHGGVALPDFSIVSLMVAPEVPRSDFNDLLIILLSTGLHRNDALMKLRGQLIFGSTQHNDLLNKIINKIVLIDFRLLSGVEADQKVRSNHYLVIVIEQVLALAKKNNWGICRNHDFVYLFNSEYWRLIADEELKTFLGEAAEVMGVDKYIARHFNFREQLYKQFIALANLPKPEQQNELVCINLRNGTFEITPTKTHLRAFNSTDFMTYQLDFDYSPEAKAPIFDAYLNKVIPDKTKQDILSEYLGYIFIRTTTLKLEKTLLLYGAGANGKSVFYEVARQLFGEQNTSEFSLQSLTNDNGYYRAMIANKLVNYASEINGKLEASIFKQLVSGEPVEARLPYGKPFTVTNYAKLMFNCNELPKDVEHTPAYFRRFLIIPFDVTISESEQDRHLAQKIIKNELSGVFNWVLEGLNRLLTQKQFTECESVRQAVEQYEKESDSVKQYISERNYVPSSGDFISIKTLYEDYRLFCVEDGFYPVKKLNFISRLESMKIVIDKRNFGKAAFLRRS